MKKIYLLTACVLALSLSACDSKEQNQTTTKTDTPTTPTPPTPTTPTPPTPPTPTTPTTPTTPVEPTNTATEPFTIKINSLTEYFGASLKSEWYQIALVDEEKKLISVKKADTNLVFENIAVGNYKICLTNEAGDKCNIFYKKQLGGLDENTAEVINNNAEIDFKMPKVKSVAINLTNANITDIPATSRGTILECETMGPMSNIDILNAKQLIFFDTTANLTNCVFGTKVAGIFYKYSGSNTLEQFDGNSMPSVKFNIDNTTRQIDFKLP